MIEKNLDVIYNKKYLVILPESKKDLLDGFIHSFKNVYVLKNNLNDLNLIISFINKNNFKTLYFVNYILEYQQIIKELKKEHEINMIFTESLASFSDSYIYEIFNKTLKMAKEHSCKMGIIDKSLYVSLKKNNPFVKHIKLDIEKIESKPINKNDKRIGILNSNEDAKHSYFNELSAIKLLDDYTLLLPSLSKTTKVFLKTFDIKYEISSKIDSFINLYINFTNNNILTFLKIMDSGKLCILGNTDILDEFNYLKEMLTMKSDDDINEIASRIKLVEKNKDKIEKEYEIFRKKYAEESKKSIEEFLNLEIETETEENNEYLLTVVVPIYNVEKYLENSLKSILNAKINNMEILLINDGSTDNSEKIALKYKEKYPDIIKYIKQENHGLGYVRNVGLKEAKGKYIASIDSDDTIDKNFFKEALKYLKKDIDIIICDWLTVTDTENYETTAIDYIFNNLNAYEGLLYTTIMPSTCNKIIKKKLFKDLNIKYATDKYEDLSTNTFIMLKAETIKYIHKPYYKYYIRSNSIMRTKPGLSMINIIKMLNER